MLGLRNYYLEGRDGHRANVARYVYKDGVDSKSFVGIICDQCNMTGERISKNIGFNRIS